MIAEVTPGSQNGVEWPVTDSKPAEVDTAKEMEESPEVPTDHDQGRF